MATAGLASLGVGAVGLLSGVGLGDAATAVSGSADVTA